MPSQNEPVEAWGADEEPDGFIWQTAEQPILEVVNRWRVHTRWWEPRDEVWREYLKVVTDGGLFSRFPVRRPTAVRRKVFCASQLVWSRRCWRLLWGTNSWRTHIDGWEPRRDRVA